MIKARVAKYYNASIFRCYIGKDILRCLIICGLTCFKTKFHYFFVISEEIMRIRIFPIIYIASLISKAFTFVKEFSKKMKGIVFYTRSLFRNLQKDFIISPTYLRGTDFNLQIHAVFVSFNFDFTLQMSFFSLFFMEESSINKNGAESHFF